MGAVTVFRPDGGYSVWAEFTRPSEAEVGQIVGGLPVYGDGRTRLGKDVRLAWARNPGPSQRATNVEATEIYHRVHPGDPPLVGIVVMLEGPWQ